MQTSVEQRDFLILGAILLLALILRLWGLNAPLWYDEILTLESHIRLPWGEMMQTYSMNHHYLFSLQSKLFVTLFGESPWTLRMPSLVFGVASIAAMWWLARDLVGRWAAHITALLLALSYHHIWFSQNARGYTELAFWSALAMGLFLIGMRQPSIKIWLGYGVCMVLAVATHLTGLFFFIAQGFVWLFVALRAFPAQGLRAPIILWPVFGYIVGGLLTLLFYVPILPSLIETMGMVSATTGVDVMAEYRNPVWSLFEGVRTAIGSLGLVVGIVIIAVLTLISLGMWLLSAKDTLYSVIVVLHIAVTIALLMAIDMRIWPRFFFADIGFVMLLIVLGVHFATELFTRYVRLMPQKILFTLAIAGMVLISVGMASRNYSAPKQNLQGAYKFAEITREDGARVYAVGVASKIFNGFYAAGWGTIEDNAQFMEALAQPGPLIFVVAFPARSLRVVSELESRAEGGALELLKVFPGTLGDGAVLVYQRG